MTVKSRLFIAFRPLIMVAVLCFVCGCSGEQEQWNVLLITLDTLRADHLGCYGNDQVRTPNIDALARRGILFERVYAPAPSTLPSHASIMTGLYPQQHGVRDNGVYYLPEKIDTLSEILSKSGYATAAFVSAFVLNNQFGLCQGFDLFEDSMEDPMVETLDDDERLKEIPEYARWWQEQWTRPFQRYAENTVQGAVQWISDQPRSDPFFCWVHLFDPHMPYRPPDSWAVDLSQDYDGFMDGTMATAESESEKLGGQLYEEDIARMIELYDCEISYTDHWLGRLIDGLKKSGADQRTLIVLTADHGEAFGEHLGLVFEHNASVYDEVLHVPLIVAPPTMQEGGFRRSSVSSLVDVLPTVLDYLNLPKPAALPGRSLRRKSNIEHPVYFEALCSKQALPNPVFFKGVRQADWKLFCLREKDPNGRKGWFLFHSREDPGEKDNLVLSAVQERKKLEGALKKFLELSRVNEQNPTNFWPLEDDQDRIERMKALGYIK